MTRLTACGIALLALTAAALVYLLPWDKAEGLESLRTGMTTIVAASVGVYFLAVWLVLRQPQPRHAIWVVLIVAAAMRLPMLFAPPILSSDIYRYIWDGRVQAAWINPYLYVPVDPALAPLRDAAIYPRINRRDYAHTIYPPTAQAVFAAMGRISQTVFAEKLAMVAFEGLAIVCAIKLLALLRLPTERVLIYAWNPLAVWSFAMDGHVDAVGIGLLAGAFLLLAKRRDGLAGIVFGAAALVKFFPLSVGPALWRQGGRWRFAGGTALAIVALYACYASAGSQVLGFLPGYGAEEALDNGEGIWLLAGLAKVFSLPAYALKLYGVVVLLVLGAMALWATTRPDSHDMRALCGRAAALAAVATVVVGPHYHWYFAWLALPAIVAPSRAVIFLSAAPILLVINPFDDAFFWASLIYVPAIALALAERCPWLSPIEGTSPCPKRL